MSVNLHVGNPDTAKMAKYWDFLGLNRTIVLTAILTAIRVKIAQIALQPIPESAKNRIWQGENCKKVLPKCLFCVMIRVFKDKNRLSQNV